VVRHSLKATLHKKRKEKEIIGAYLGHRNEDNPPLAN